MKRLPLLGLVIAGVSATGLALSGGAAAAGVDRMTIPVDGQEYVADAQTTNPTDGTVVDVYLGDPSVIHVAMHGGTEQARSFVHMALGYLPEHAVAEQVTLTVHVAEKTDASSKGNYSAYNVNTESAIVEACVLKTPFDSSFDRDNPPAADCAAGSALGKPNKTFTTWTFELAKLLPYWTAKGNTGLALLPIAADPSATWSVSFSKPKSVAKVTYHLAATGTQSPQTPTSGGGAAPGAGGGSVAPPPSSSQGVTPLAPVQVPANPGTGVTTDTGTSAPAVAGSPATTAPQSTPAASTSDGANNAWPWVLVGCILLAAGSIGVAHRAAVLAWAQRVVPPGLAAFRAHPRAYSVASAALAWGLVFTSYSLVTAPGGSPAQQLAGDQPATQTAPGSTPGATAPQAGASTAPGVAAGGTGAGTVTSGSSTTVTSSGTSTPSAPEQAVKQEFDEKGTWRTINGIQVFFPADGSAPVAKLYSGAEDVVGITPDELRICAHAALTYGAAFNINASDLDVYWDYVNDHGGIFGRKVVTNYQNDNYDPGQAVSAAQACKDWGTFLLLGGIGFDQIPAVRQWAEQNHELYIHHDATIKGTAGQRYSFSSLPTVEQLGEWFGQLAINQFKGKKVGIIYRQSANWQPGYDLFRKTIEAAGMQIVGAYGTTVNQANYTQEIAQLHTKGAEVVFGWENALAVTEMLKQAQGQNYHPAWLLFPFNLTTNTLGNSSLDQDLWGVASWDAYDPGYYGGGFAPYADQIKEFEAQYKKYDPNANLAGDGGDLLFLNWEAQKGLHALLAACGPDCTRNKIAGLLLAGWHKPVPPNCPADFGRTDDHHHGGYTFNVFHVVRDPNGRPNWVPARRCITGI